MHYLFTKYIYYYMNLVIAVQAVVLLLTLGIIFLIQSDEESVKR